MAGMKLNAGADAPGVWVVEAAGSFLAVSPFGDAIF